MATGHLLVHLLDGAVQVGVAVLLVHVVDTSAAVVAHSDGVVLHLGGALLEDLM